MTPTSIVLKGVRGVTWHKLQGCRETTVAWLIWVETISCDKWTKEIKSKKKSATVLRFHFEEWSPSAPKPRWDKCIGHLMLFSISVNVSGGFKPVKNVLSFGYVTHFFRVRCALWTLIRCMNQIRIWVLRIVIEDSLIPVFLMSLAFGRRWQAGLCSKLHYDMPKHRLLRTLCVIDACHADGRRDLLTSTLTAHTSSRQQETSQWPFL